MEAPICDVIGCSEVADRFYSDGVSPIERLCAQHWNELLKAGRNRALQFERINPERLRDPASAAEPPRVAV